MTGPGSLPMYCATIWNDINFSAPPYPNIVTIIGDDEQSSDEKTSSTKMQPAIVTIIDD